jgi:S-adenosylmethionine:tRNA ribosyltransferase-isomerase
VLHATAVRRADFHFDLPPEQIAQRPVDRRDGSRLLVLGPDGGVADRSFADVVELLPADAVLVVNDTRVIPARVRGVRPTGGGVELLFVEPQRAPASGDDGAEISGSGSGRESLGWRCLARARRPIRAGQTILVGDVTLTVVAGREEDETITVAVPGDPLAFLDAHGEVPLPPYIERPTDAPDRERYQTVYARAPGAVAAPTAGLHFTPALLAALEARGVAIAPITLHVGLGTFAPVRVDDLDDHRMHRERYQIPERTAALIASGRPVVAVGTTCVRTLEAAARGPRRVAAGPGDTDLFLRPGARFQIVDHLITNFHLPESTLLVLVCAFAGTAPVLAAYRHAVAAGYRFFSYGDAMLCSRA